MAPTTKLPSFCGGARIRPSGFNSFRSCAYPFILADDYAHAQRYISLDENFGAFMRLRIATRRGDKKAVLVDSNISAKLGFRNMDHFHELLRACVNHAPEAELTKAVAQLEADPVAQRDAEVLYQNAETLGFCGQPEAALRQLRKAIQGNYCSYPAMEKDPQFDLIRHRPEFTELEQAGRQCQQSFQTHRQQADAARAVPFEKSN